MAFSLTLRTWLGLGLVAKRKLRCGWPPSAREASARRRFTRRGGRHTSLEMSEPLTLTAVFTPDENGWTMAQLAEWPAVVTCGRTLEEARAMLLDAAQEMIASYRDEGREPPIGGGHVESVTIDLAA
jgi:predicted RNase H-like HicB family nuclease